MIRIVPLKFQQAGRQYNFDATTLELKAGDKVVVETDRGRAMATVVVEPREIEDSDAPEGLKSILRIATEEDLALAETNSAREADAYKYCQERIKSRQLEMKLVRAEYAFDGSKIIFFFTADGRIAGCGRSDRSRLYERKALPACPGYAFAGYFQRTGPAGAVWRGLLRRGRVPARAQGAERGHQVAPPVADRDRRDHLWDAQPGANSAVDAQRPRGAGVLRGQRAPLCGPEGRPL